MGYNHGYDDGYHDGYRDGLKKGGDSMGGMVLDFSQDGGPVIPLATTEIPGQLFHLYYIIGLVSRECTKVGDYAFIGCYNISSVSLPACTQVGDSAFGECESLSSVSLPACTHVGGFVFSDCSELSSVSLPACVQVGNGAFDGCYSLSSVSLPSIDPADEIEAKDLCGSWGLYNPGCTVEFKRFTITITDE